jgi:hypothetical protein
MRSQDAVHLTRGSERCLIVAHFAPSPERLEFFWWEVDLAHYVLVGLSWVGVVWDLKKPPRRAYELGERAQAA